MNPDIGVSKATCIICLSKSLSPPHSESPFLSSSVIESCKILSLIILFFGACPNVTTSYPPATVPYWDFAKCWSLYNALPPLTSNMQIIPQDSWLIYPVTPSQVILPSCSAAFNPCPTPAEGITPSVCSSGSGGTHTIKWNNHAEFRMTDNVQIISIWLCSPSKRFQQCKRNEAEKTRLGTTRQLSHSPFCSLLLTSC